MSRSPPASGLNKSSTATKSSRPHNWSDGSAPHEPGETQGPVEVVGRGGLTVHNGRTLPPVNIAVPNYASSFSPTEIASHPRSMSTVRKVGGEMQPLRIMTFNIQALPP